MKNNFVILQIEGKEAAHLYCINDAAIVLALDKLLYNMQTAAIYKPIEKINRVSLIKLKGEENDITRAMGRVKVSLCII